MTNKKNDILNDILQYILSDKKLTVIALALSVFFIYRAGKAFGQFLYYIIN